MKTQKNTFQFMNSIAFIILLMCSTLAKAQSVVVNSTNYKQTIDMIGGDMERSSKAIQSAQNKADILQWSFGDIDFNVCRVQYDKNQELVEGVKNWSFYDKQVTTMQAIKAINPNIKFFGTMRSDYDGYGNDNNMPDWIQTYSTKATDVVKYGIFLADYCEYMSNQGVPIAILSTAKEWMWHVRASEAVDIINTLYAQLDLRGIQKPLISDQGFWSISQGITYLNNVESLGSKDLYDSFCSHNYDNEAPEKWVEIIQKSVALGKPMYDDETSTGSGSPTYGEERAMFKQIDEYIKKAKRYESGLSGEVYFEIWSRGINKETRSIYFPSSGEGRRLRGYYMMKQFSNNVLDHRYITSTVNGASNVYTITFRKDDKMVLWVINEGTSGYTLPITMDQSTITSTVATHYWTNDTPIEGSSTSYIASGNTFTPTVAGESMNCYIFDVTEDAVDICGLSDSSIIEAECYDVMQGVTTEASTEGTDNVTSIENGDWLKFETVDLGSGATQFSARVSTNTAGGNIEIRTGSPAGTVAGTLTVTNTGGLQNWKTVTTNITELAGTQDLYFVFTGATGSLFNVNWFQLKAAEPSVVLDAETSNKTVDLTWTVQNMVPVTQNIYRNAFFSETGKTLIAANVAGTSYSDSNVINGETYYYWIEVTDASTNISKSNTVEAKPSIPNLALASHGSIATQSTTDYEGVPERAIDGNTDGSYGNNSVSHTEHGTVGSNTLKWWQVDLQANYNIETINIYNRTGSNYGESLNNFTVEVKDASGNITFTQLYADYPNPLLTIDTGGVVGSVVRISKTSDNGITLAEVEVYGEDTVLSNKTFEKNNIEIFPNPVKNSFTITNSSNAVVEIYSVLGKLMLKKNINSNKQSIDVSNLIQGLYVLKVNNKGYTTIKKIIKD